MIFEKKYHFSDTQFRLFQKLIMDFTSIKIADQKKELIYGRVVRRLRKLNLTNFDEYYNIIKNRENPEVENFINVVTTNLTSFFREPHHFEHIASVAIPEIIKENSAARKLRIWSAGCSTGEEPYSIAMTLFNAIPDLHHWDVKILATDIDTDVISIANRGIYHEKDITNFSLKQKKKWFKKGRGEYSGCVKVSSELQSIISFKQLNLLDPWPMKKCFDIIFCRNVVIYFDKSTQLTLFDKFSNAISNNGYMYIGHSETLYDVNGKFELLGKTSYKKRG